MAKSTLALDLGTNCGWAYRFHDVVLSGAWNLKPNRYDGGGMRFVKFIEQLNHLHDAKEIGAVVFEEVRAHKGVDAAHVYGGLMATLQAWCEGKGIPYEGVPVGAIKKFATGKGNASKDQMIEAAESWGYSPTSDDEADALCLLHLKTGHIVKDLSAEFV
jgi:Holliday junction resolvasome RuvABC endonuclease subunit